MRKSIKDLEGEITKVDMFMEVRDARIPITSHNPELISLLPAGMKKLVILNKIDLANEKITFAIVKKLEE
jgi:ribosome biogenesis GTPase A